MFWNRLRKMEPGAQVLGAAAILGVPAEKLRDHSRDLSGNSRWCILENPDDSKKGVTFTVSRADSVDQAASEFQQFRQHASKATGIVVPG